MAIPLPNDAVGVGSSGKGKKQEPEERPIEERLKDIPADLFETSDEDIEFPNIPQATDIEDVGFFESLIPNVKSMFVRDDVSKAEIMKKSFSGDERFGGVFSDKFNNPMIVWNDKPYYINKPGFGLPDVATFTAEIAKYLPASRFVAKARGLKETVQRGLTTYPATEAASIAGEVSFGSGNFKS